MLKPFALTRTVFVLAGILALTLPLFAQGPGADAAPATRPRSVR